MKIPTLKEIDVDTVQDARSAIIEADAALRKIREVSDVVFADVENEDYEAERVFNDEVRRMCANLDEMAFWTESLLREMREKD